MIPIAQAEFCLTENCLAIVHYSLLDMPHYFTKSYMLPLPPWDFCRSARLMSFFLIYCSRCITAFMYSIYFSTFFLHTSPFILNLIMKLFVFGMIILLLPYWQEIRATLYPNPLRKCNAVSLISDWNENWSVIQLYYKYYWIPISMYA